MIKIIIVHVNYFFGQGLYPWDSMDLGILKEKLNNLNYKVDFIDINDVKYNIFSEYDLIWYASSQKIEEKKIFEDKLFHEYNTNKLIPRFEMLLAHENKGFQSIIKDEIGLNYLNEEYLISNSVIYKGNVVYKTCDGAGSHGVFLPKNNIEYNKKINSILKSRISFKEVINLIKLKIKKRILFSWRYSKSVWDYRKSNLRIVAQDFIPNLRCDYKVLVFGDCFYVLKRNIKDNDFRASGSGLFEFIDNCEPSILYCALELYKKLDVPYLSVDISLSENSVNIIEFQVCHFGPYTYLKSEYKYTYNGCGWIKIKDDKISLEEKYVYALDFYIKNKNKNKNEGL